MIKPKTKVRGYVLHEGDDFFVVATMQTTNRKTGDMVQIWILLRDVSPVEGVKTGLDAETVCIGCIFANGNGCYVNVGQAPLAVWKGYHANIYPYLEPRTTGGCSLTGCLGSGHTETQARYHCPR